MVTVADHYGISRERAKQMYKEIIGEVFTNDNVSGAIDKIFSELSAEQRCKIFEYALAFHIFQKCEE